MTTSVSRGLKLSVAIAAILVLLAALSALIKGAREVRLSSFQACQYCGLRTPPESLHDTGVCQSCSDRHSGAIH